MVYIDETLHSCSIRPEDVHEGRQFVGKTTTKGDNSRGTNICGEREGDILCDLTHSSSFLGDRLGAHCLIYLVRAHVNVSKVN